MGRSKFSFDLMMHLWPLDRVQSWAARQPLLRLFMHTDVSSRRSRHIIVPVNQVISGSESVVLPPMVLETLIDRASTLVVLNQCLCRRAEGCQAYPRELGCLFLGDAAGQIDPALCRALTPQGARAHTRRGVELGLTPMIVHSAFDAALLGIDFRRMLAVCFCCDCCCTVRHNLRDGPREYADTVLRFPGLQVEVGPGCTGCGECLQVCHASALDLVDGRLVIGEACKGCGCCALACPLDVIHLRLEEENRAMARLLALVEERTTIGPLNETGQVVTRAD